MKETSLQNGAAGLIARASQHFSSDALVRPQSRIEERVRRPWSAFDVVTLAPTLAMPLFVIHDRGDAEIPWQPLARVDLSSDRRPAPRRPEAPDVASARNRPDRPSDWNCLKKRYHGPPGSRSWPPPAYLVGSRLPWRKRRRYSSKARSRSIGIGSAS